MDEHFRQFARYNRWANRRLFEAVATLDDDAYRQDRGAFFRSIHGTLNHILVADRIWLGRIQGSDPGIRALDAILYDDRAALDGARDTTDQQIIEEVDRCDAARLNSVVHYSTMAGEPCENRLRWILAHVFNHQTHHRGQAHNMLSQSGGDPPPLDLMIYLRTLP